jgi:hypothetical protein
MSGFTYGGSAGATYGGSAGALWSPGGEDWRLDGTAIPTVVDETRTWQELSLTWHVNSANLTDLEGLQTTAEKLDTILLPDGSFETVDRSASGGTHTLAPPPDRSPPREDREYVVASYDQRPLDRAVGEFAVTVSFRAISNREPPAAAVDESRASDEWSFELRSATIATKRVTPAIEQGTETNADRVTLTLVLDPTETRILEESLTRLGAASVRDTPDDAAVYTDDSASPTDANTVTVTTPDGKDPIRDGDWIATEWVTDWLSKDAHRVTLTLGDPG